MKNKNKTMFKQLTILQMEIGIEIWNFYHEKGWYFGVYRFQTLHDGF